MITIFANVSIVSYCQCNYLLHERLFQGWLSATLLRARDVTAKRAKKIGDVRTDMPLCLQDAPALLKMLRESIDAGGGNEFGAPDEVPVYTSGALPTLRRSAEDASARESERAKV